SAWCAGEPAQSRGMRMRIRGDQVWLESARGTLAPCSLPPAERMDKVKGLDITLSWGEEGQVIKAVYRLEKDGLQISFDPYAPDRRPRDLSGSRTAVLWSFQRVID